MLSFFSLFVIYIVINTDCASDDREILVAMNSTLEQPSLVWVTFASAAELYPDNHGS
jgi:hypothetical protein